MNTTVDRKDFKAALSLACAVARKRAPTLAQTHVRLSAAGGALDVAATDLDTSVRVPLRLDGRGSGTAIVPAHDLAAFVRAAKGERVTLDLGGDALTVNGSLRVAGLSPADYPEVPGVLAEDAVTLDAADFAAAARTVAFCVSGEVVRYALTGVYFDGPRRALVASDGKRLAAYNFSGRKAKVTAIIPAQAVDLARRLAERVPADRDKDAVRLAVDAEGTWGRLTVGDAAVTFRAIDRPYPQWESVVPKGDPVATFSPVELLGAVEQIMPAVSEVTCAVLLTVCADRLQLDAADGERTARASVQARSTVSASVRLNVHYLRDYLRAIKRHDAHLDGALYIDVRPQYLAGGLVASATRWDCAPRHRYALMPLKK